MKDKLIVFICVVIALGSFLIMDSAVFDRLNNNTCEDCR